MQSGKELKEVAIAECVHFCGFRYGRNEYHPYETYVRRLHRGEPLNEIRAEFVDFLEHYRPRHFGEALGIALSRNYPMWAYPWLRIRSFIRPFLTRGWVRKPRRIPDIITHFSEAGIPGSLLASEYTWLEGAYQAISRSGYQPEKFGYPQAMALEKSDGARAYLILDGNHRISSLAALGYGRVRVQYVPGEMAVQAQARTWLGVRTGIYSEADAIRILESYFRAHTNYRTHEGPVPPIVD